MLWMLWMAESWCLFPVFVQSIVRGHLILKTILEQRQRPSMFTCYYWSSTLSTHDDTWVSTTRWRRQWEWKLWKAIMWTFRLGLLSTHTKGQDWTAMLILSQCFKYCCGRKYKVSDKPATTVQVHHGCLGMFSACYIAVDEVGEVEIQMLLEALCMIPQSLFLLEAVCGLIETSVLLWPLWPMTKNVERFFKKQ